MESVEKRLGWKGRAARGVIGFTFVAFVSIYAGISLFTADRLTRATNHPSRLDPRAWVAGAKPWSTLTSDRITLRGWHLPTHDRRHFPGSLRPGEACAWAQWTCNPPRRRSCPRLPGEVQPAGGASPCADSSRADPAQTLPPEAPIRSSRQQAA